MFPCVNVLSFFVALLTVVLPARFNTSSQVGLSIVQWVLAASMFFVFDFAQFSLTADVVRSDPGVIPSLCASLTAMCVSVCDN